MSRLKSKAASTKKKISKDIDSTFTFSEVLIVVIISILFGIVIGYVATCSRPIIGGKSYSKVSEIVDTYRNIVDNYYDEVNQEELANAAIKGMIESLGDPYSNYMDLYTTEDFNESVDGSFVGIGVSVLYDSEQSYNVVLDVMKNSPAYKSGVQVNDVIVKVDGEDVAGLFGDDISKLIKGKVGTSVTITVRRGDEFKNISMKREKVEVTSVMGKTFDIDNYKTGYIKIDSISSNTYNQFYKEINRLEKKKIKSLIIDVRGNPGGHLLQTRQILSLFFPRKTVLYYVQSKNNKKKIYSDNNTVRKYPVVVLVNSGTASAAEIIASCFQDNYSKAKIIGVTTYGKGTVQKSQSLSTGTSIKYTTQKWLTSKGKWINEKGITPDIVVEQAEDYYNNPNYNTDVQLQEAIKYIKESN